MKEVIIYHNPRCSKSRETLKILHEQNATVKIIEYLKERLTQKELQELLEKLEMKPSELIRKEQEYKELLEKHQTITEGECLALLVAHPHLIQRPIVVLGNRAVLGRPPENVEIFFREG